AMRDLPSKTLPLIAAALLAWPAAACAQDEDEPASQPTKADVRKLVLAGQYLDLPEAGMSVAALLGGGAQPKAFYALLKGIEDLGKGDDQRPILVDLSQDLAVNLAQVAELERAFAKLRAGGKKTFAYLEGADLVRYEVATLCDQVLLADMGGVDLRS